MHELIKKLSKAHPLNTLLLGIFFGSLVMLVLMTVGYFLLVSDDTKFSAETIIEEDPLFAYPDEVAAVDDAPDDRVGFENEDVRIEITERDHILGSSNAPVTIVEYSDFECPYCQEFYSVVKQAVEDFGSDVQFIYRHYPLATIHNEAMPAAIAAECAGEQDMFFEYHDALFEAATLSESLYPVLAADLGLDKDMFQACLDRAEESKIIEDINSGLEYGVDGTPGIFIIDRSGNSFPVAGAVPYKQLKVLIEQALEGF
jgi:protein-disulfide isomerase